jgi:protein-L-isoaspartate(D-aspartate) O-methyltransferase
MVVKFLTSREDMVEQQLRARGVRSPAVLAAMRAVPREAFLPETLRKYAYEDVPLPIDAGQTMSQPYIVAMMVEALDLQSGDKVLEVGTGSGYAAAVLAQMGGEVYTVERIGALAEQAAAALKAYDNVHVRQGDGTLGWPEQAPFDAIIVAAGGPDVPDTLKRQLKPGGRLVIPVGSSQREQALVRVTRAGPDEFKTEELMDVRFVPLVGKEGWVTEDPLEHVGPAAGTPVHEKEAVAAIARAAEVFDTVEDADLDGLLARIGDARIVLIGEATHGTSEFYRMRARISQELILRRGFSFIAMEGDWPDVARFDHYVRHFEYPLSEWAAFARFPTWMWRNTEVKTFVDWLRHHNAERGASKRVAMYGLDLYSLFTSIKVILGYLDEMDPDGAKLARLRYGCLSQWEDDPETYGHAAMRPHFQTCEDAVARMLDYLLQKRLDYTLRDGERFMDAVQNARLVADAERYYRALYRGSRVTWNLRDNHMFETLKNLLEFHGPEAKAIVWAHNSHVGNAAATEMAARGEYNIGHLCREEFGDACYAIGFGTNTGKVAAASDWEAPMEVKTVLPAQPRSYEFLCHATGLPRFMLPLRARFSPEVWSALLPPRLERAIGVLYRPETEMASHYFQAVLPDQFDEYIWFDETNAVTPIETKLQEGTPDTFPFGL